MPLTAVPLPTTPTRVRYLVLAWLCLLATLSYVHRGCIAVPAERIQHELKIDKDDMAQIMSAFFLGYTVFQLPSGWLGDRWGARHALTIFILLWSAATGWMGLASGLLGLWLSRLVNGIAQAGIFPCCVQSIARWFPESQKAFPNGMLGSFMSVGAAIATALTGLLLRFLSWQATFLWLALPGFACAVAFYLWFRDKPEEHRWVNSAELDLIHHGQPAVGAAQEANAASVWSILLSLPMLLVCAQQFFRAAGYIFYVTWYPTLLQKTRNVSVEDSGYLTSLALLGVVVGSAVGGYLLDWIYRVTGNKQLSRRGVALVSLIACAALVSTAYHIEDGLLTSVVLGLSSICAGLAGPAAYTITIDMGKGNVATVFSTMNMMGNLGAFLMPLLVVELVDWYSWNEALLLLAGLYLAAAACWALVKVDSK